MHQLYQSLSQIPYVSKSLKYFIYFNNIALYVGDNITIQRTDESATPSIRFENLSFLAFEFDRQIAKEIYVDCAGCRDKYKPPSARKNHSRFSSPAYGRRYLHASVYPEPMRRLVVIIRARCHHHRHRCVAVAVGFIGERREPAGERNHERQKCEGLASSLLPAADARLISFWHGAIVRLVARGFQRCHIAGAICRH